MPVTSVAKADAEDLRQKRIVIILISVCVLGFSYAGYDYVQIVNRVSLPEDITQVVPIVEQWKREGLVQSFDPIQATLVVNEEKWNEQEREAKIGIITQVARYCAKKNNLDVWTVKIVGSRSLATLGELGRRGLVLQ